MSFFKKIDTKVPDKKQDFLVEDPIMYSDPSPEIYIVSDFLNKSIQVKVLKKLLSLQYGREVSFCLLYPYRFVPQGNDLTKNITDFVFNFSIDYKKYIPFNSKVLTLGRALYSFTYETSLQPSAFYSYHIGKTYIFYPPLNSWIFPADEFFKFFHTGENRFLDNWNIHFLKKQISFLKDFQVKKVRVPNLIVEVVENPNEFLKSHIGVKEKVSWDLETDGFSFYNNAPFCMSLSFDGRKGFFLDFDKIDLSILNEFFIDKYQIGANLKFDCKFLWNLGVTNARIDFDTLNAGHCLNEMRSNTLASHGWIYTYYGGHEIELHKWKKKNPKKSTTYKQIMFWNPELMTYYSTKDSIIDFKVYEEQLKELEKDPLLYSYYFEEVIPNLNMMIDIETKGVYINWNKLKDLKKEYEEKIVSLEKEIFESFGFTINLGSTKDLGIALEKKLGYPDLGFRAKESIGGYYLTGDAQLKEWKKRGFSIMEKVIEHRSYNTFIDTFIGDEQSESSYWAFRNPKTDTVHPTYMTMLANSHRNKCRNPNLQQAPKRGEEAKKYRFIFDAPSEDYFISEGDFAGLQLRIAAVISGDEKLKKVFSVRGADLHSETAINIFHPDMTLEEFLKVKGSEPYKTHRNIAKGVNFAFLFGGSAWAFADKVLRIEWSLEDCITFLNSRNINYNSDSDLFLLSAEEIRNSFFRAYHGLKLWHESCHKEAETTGIKRSVHGARRLLPQLLYIGKDSDKKEIAELRNISKNTAVQNFEIVVIMRAMRNIYKRIKEENLKSFIFGMIHDASEHYIYKKEKDYIKDLLLNEYEKDYPEYDGVIFEFELDISDPHDKENPTSWGFGEEWI
jgi:DNA polymerase I-like protein with 3'-5' exonuclease and polymerase domains